MKWQEERYVKLYVRDTAEFLAMSWQARCLLYELLRKVDPDGRMKVGDLGLQALAVAVRAPADEIAAPISELLKQGRLVHDEKAGEYVIPNFVAAQNASQSSAARKRRERGVGPTRPLFRGGAVGGRGASEPADGAATVTVNAEASDDVEPEPVTLGHVESRAVTRSHTGQDDVCASAVGEEAGGESGLDSTVAGNRGEMSGPVTRSHAKSRPVTPSHDQIRSEEIRSEEIRSRQPTMVGSGREEGATPEVAGRTATLVPLAPDTPLTDEMRAYAQSIGITDVPTVFADFVNYNIAEGKVATDWHAMWRLWCSRALRMQRRDRERDRARGGRAAPMQLDDPDAPRGWTMPEVRYMKREPN